MSERAQKIWEAFKGELCIEPTDDMREALATAIRIVADELSYTIFMPNNDVRVVETRELYGLANELDQL
jgi:hypothetical protein